MGCSGLRRIRDRCAQHFSAELPPVDGDDFGTRRQARLVSGRVQVYVDHRAVRPRFETERVRHIHPLARGFEILLVIGAFGGVDQAVAAIGDAAQRGVVDGRLQPFIEEGGPIVRLYGVEGSDYILEGVGFHFGSRCGRTRPEPAEIIERSAALAQGADSDVGIEPDEGAFFVVIDGAAQIAIIGAGSVEDLRGDGGIGQRAPFPAALPAAAGRSSRRAAPRS